MKPLHERLTAIEIDAIEHAIEILNHLEGEDVTGGDDKLQRLEAVASEARDWIHNNGWLSMDISRGDAEEK